MLYQYAVPRALPQHEGVAFCGQVAYPDHVVDIPAEAVDDEFVRRMARLVQRISAEESARRVPSAGECRFCDVLTCLGAGGG